MTAQPHIIPLNYKLSGQDNSESPDVSAVFPENIEIQYWPQNDGYIALIVASSRLCWIDTLTKNLLHSFYGTLWAEITARLRMILPIHEVDQLISELYNTFLLPEKQINFIAHPSCLESRPITGLTLNITDHCNLNCKYCFGQQEYMFHARNMDSSDLRRAIDLLARFPSNQKRIIQFFGGEPLLAFDLIRDIVNYAAEAYPALCDCFEYSITTNATLITPEVARWLANHRFLVTVSVDGLADFHNLQRQYHSGLGSWETVWRGIRNLQNESNGSTIRVTCVLTHQMLSSVLSIVESFIDKGIRDIYLCPVRNAPPDMAFTKNDYVLYLEIHRQLLERRYHDSNYKEVDLGGFGNIASRVELCGKAHYGCSASIGISSACILSNGDVYPCYRIAKIPEFRIGNVADDFLPSDWRVQFVQNDVDHRECASCWARYLCGGGCPAQSILVNGDLHVPDNKSCPIILDNTVQIIRSYSRHILANLDTEITYIERLR